MLGKIQSHEVKLTAAIVFAAGTLGGLIGCYTFQYLFAPKTYIHTDVEDDGEHKSWLDCKYLKRLTNSESGRSCRFELARQVALSQWESMPSRIILVRHGESEGNADMTLYRTKPDNLVELTVKGWEQAFSAGDKIKDICGDCEIEMFTSPFTRTLQTANAIKSRLANNQVVRLNIDPRIREQEFGNIQGDEFAKLRGEQKRVGRFYYRFPTGESGADVWDRTKQWWNTLMSINLVQTDPIDTVVVVTHGLTMRLFLMQLYEWSPNTFHSVWNAGNCAMYVFDKLDRPEIVCSKEQGCHRKHFIPYQLNSTLGDVPQSSIDVEVTFRSDSTKRKLVLNDFLALPQPRLHQFPLAKFALAKEYDLDVNDIDSIKCVGNFHGTFSTSSFTVAKMSHMDSLSDPETMRRANVAKALSNTESHHKIPGDAEQIQHRSPGADP